MLENINYLYMAGLALLVIILVSFLIIKRKPKKITINEDLINGILGIIKSDNIKSISSEISRVKFEVNDLEIIDFDKLKEISEGVFISGKNVKVMFKDSADEIVSAIKNKI
ncbi:hypothetical protein RJG79_06475 [Mycoplasmatota bacterium WC44]